MQKKSTRVLSLVLSLAMVITMMAGGMTASAVSYKDIYNGHWAQSYINYLSDKEVFEGYNDGTFRPSQTVTTAELMAVISRTFGLTATKAISYADVQSTDWYYIYVSQAAAQGYILDGAYVYPNQPLTREKAVAMIARYLGLEESKSTYARFSDSSQISSAYVGYVNAAVAEGIINGYSDGTFKPQQEISRAEIAKIIYTMLGGNIIRENVTGVTSNGACITKSNITVSNSYLGGTVYVTEGCGSVTIDGSTITKLVVRGNTSVKLVNTKVGTLVLDSSNGSAAVYATGYSTVQSTTVNTDASVSDATTTGSAFAKVSAAMAANQTLSLTGTFPSVTVTTSATTLNVAGATSEITALNVTSAASGTKVTGKGTIAAITVSASGCTTEQLPGQYVIGTNIKATFAGKTFTGTGTTGGLMEVIVADDSTALAAGSTIEDNAVLVLDYGKSYAAVSVTVPAGYKLYNKSGTVVMDNSSYSYARTVTEYHPAGSYTYQLAYGGSYVSSLSFTVTAYNTSYIAAKVADTNTVLPQGSSVTNGATLVLASGASYVYVDITVPAGYVLKDALGSTVKNNSTYYADVTETVYCAVGSHTYYLYYGGYQVDGITFSVVTYTSSSVSASVADDHTNLSSGSSISNGAALVLDSSASYVKVNITVPAGCKLYSSGSVVMDNSSYSYARTAQVTCEVGSYTYYLTYGSSRVDSISFTVSRYGLSRPTYTVSRPATASSGMKITFDQTMYYGGQSIHNWMDASTVKSLVSIPGFSSYTAEVSSDGTEITLTPSTYWPSSFTVSISGSLANKDGLTVYNGTFAVTVGNYSVGTSYATAPSISLGSQSLYSGSVVTDYNNDGETITVTIPANHSLFINDTLYASASSTQQTRSYSLRSGVYQFTTYCNGYSASVTITVVGYGTSLTVSAPVIRNSSNSIVSNGRVSYSPGLSYARISVSVTPGDQLWITYPDGTSSLVSTGSNGTWESSLTATGTYTFVAVRSGAYSNSVNVTIYAS